MDLYPSRRTFFLSTGPDAAKRVSVGTCSERSPLCGSTGTLCLMRMVDGYRYDYVQEISRMISGKVF